MLRLPDLQREFLRAITRAHGLEEASISSSPLVAEIRGDGRLGAAQRLEIYAGMYCARLIDALGEDYPRVLGTLGTTAFGDIAHDYVTAHPSTQPSLRGFGRGFAEFLAGYQGCELPQFLADLARLEWARLAVFDAPDAELLDVETLRRLPPDSWANLRLRLAPAVEVLRVAWPVHKIWEAGSAFVDWQPEETWLRIWRQNDTVYQASMDLAERTALAHLQGGDEFAVLCSDLAAVVAPDAAAQTAGALVLRWIEDGVLAAELGLPLRGLGG